MLAIALLHDVIFSLCGSFGETSDQRMKLQILSDSHIEFADFELPETDADVIVLAGDIGVGMSGLEWMTKQRPTKHFIYVPAITNSTVTTSRVRISHFLTWLKLTVDRSHSG